MCTVLWNALIAGLSPQDTAAGSCKWNDTPQNRVSVIQRRINYVFIFIVLVKIAKQLYKIYFCNNTFSKILSPVFTSFVKTKSCKCLLSLFWKDAKQVDWLISFYVTICFQVCSFCIVCHINCISKRLSYSVILK